MISGFEGARIHARETFKRPRRVERLPHCLQFAFRFSASGFSLFVSRFSFFAFCLLLLWFQVSHFPVFGFRFLGSGCRESGIGLRGSRCWAPGVGFRRSDSGFSVLGLPQGTRGGSAKRFGFRFFRRRGTCHPPLAPPLRPLRPPAVESWFRVQGAGFRVQGSGSLVQGSGFRVQGLGVGVESLFGAWSLECGVVLQ